MTLISASHTGASDILVDQLQAEFGAVLAARIIEAEASDFYWEARVKERYVGQLGEYGEPDEDLARVAILSPLAGAWHVATVIVDGDGCPIDLLSRRSFEAREDAEQAFWRTH